MISGTDETWERCIISGAGSTIRAENSAKLIRMINGADVRYSDKKSAVRAMHIRELEIDVIGPNMSMGSVRCPSPKTLSQNK